MLAELEKKYEREKERKQQQQQQHIYTKCVEYTKTLRSFITLNKCYMKWNYSTEWEN